MEGQTPNHLCVPCLGEERAAQGPPRHGPSIERQIEEEPVLTLVNELQVCRDVTFVSRTDRRETSEASRNVPAWWRRWWTGILSPAASSTDGCGSL